MTTLLERNCGEVVMHVRWEGRLYLGCLRCNRAIEFFNGPVGGTVSLASISDAMRQLENSKCRSRRVRHEYL